MSPLKIISIVGLSKNAGKTSFLNWFLSSRRIHASKPPPCSEARTPHLSPHIHGGGRGGICTDASMLSDSSYRPPRVAAELASVLGEGRGGTPIISITTTGRDGEETDLLTNSPKPKVSLPKGVYFTSFDHIYDCHSSQIKGIKKLPFRVIGKNLWLYKTICPIETEIVGPSTKKEQEELIEIFKDYGCDTIIIDGSMDRKSICLSEKITDIVLVIGAATGNLNEIKQQAEKIKIYASFPTFHFPLSTLHSPLSTHKSIYGNENEICDILSKTTDDWTYLPGTLTDYSWQKIKNSFLSSKAKIVFNHPLNISLELNDLKRLYDSQKVYTKMSFPISIVAVNSFSPQNEHIDTETLRKEIKKIFPDKPIMDVTELKL